MGILTPPFVIPFASGLGFQLQFLSGQTLSNNVAVGFGSAGEVSGLAGQPIDLSLFPDFSFAMPRDGTITAISAYFRLTGGVVLDGRTATVRAQLYASPAPDEMFVPVVGTLVNLTPVLMGGSADISLTGSVTGLSIPVSANTCLMLVFSAVLDGPLDALAFFAGKARGGVAIR